MSEQTLASREEEATRLDAADTIADFRERFHIPVNWVGDPVVYFCGNSLGLQPVSTIDYVDHELRQWREVAVDGHFAGTHPWVPYHDLVVDGLAEIVGAKRPEVVAMNALSVNLHLMMVSFFRPEGDRTRIVLEEKAFPSDQYAAESQLRFHGLDPGTNLVQLRSREGEYTLRTSDIVDFLEREGDSVALLLLGGVNYYTGQLFDMEAITVAGHKAGCLVGFDLAHAVGNTPLHLHDWDVDFAVWCTYKYLNAGPGAVGGAFVHERHLRHSAIPRFGGWWGHNKSTRFEMPPEFDPIPTAEGWQISNSPIFYMASLRASLEIFAEAGLDNLRRKSLRLTAFLESVLLELDPRPFEIITPSNPNERGAQLSLLFDDDARPIFNKLREADIVCDFREPNVVRVAPAPLYNTFHDVVRFAKALAQSA